MASPIESPDEAGPSRQERRKAETRRRLLEAASALFVERGYDATRPQDIAKKADQGVGTFYFHFEDKRAVFLALTEKIGEDLLAAVAARMRPDMTFRETMEAALRALFDFFSENQGFLWSATADAAVAGNQLPSGSPMLEMLTRPLARALSKAIEQGHVSSNFDPELIAHGVNGFVYHSLLYAAKNDLDRDVVLANLLEFLTRAFELSD